MKSEKQIQDQIDVFKEGRTKCRKLRMEDMAEFWDRKIKLLRWVLSE